MRRGLFFHGRADDNRLWPRGPRRLARRATKVAATHPARTLLAALLLLSLSLPLGGASLGTAEAAMSPASPPAVTAARVVETPDAGTPDPAEDPAPAPAIAAPA